MFETEKSNLIEEARARVSTELTRPVSIVCGGVHVRMRFSGREAEAQRSFVDSYYRPHFIDTSGLAPEIELIYTAASGVMASPAHRIWNTEWPDATRFEREDGLTTLVHRDFVVIEDRKQDVYLASGPILSELSTDTLDNLLNAITASALLRKNRLILHAAAIERNDQAYVFFGPSGAGKTTLGEYCHFGLGLRIIGTDQTYLGFDDQGHLFASACPSTNPNFSRVTGWCTEPKRVAGLFYISREGENRIKTCDDARFLRVFLRESLPFLESFEPADRILQVVARIARAQGFLKGEIRYPKNFDIWKNIDAFATSQSQDWS